MLYQLIGPKYLQVGNRVDMGPIGERWGVIVKVVKEDFKLPNSRITGQTKFWQQPVNLFLIQGGYDNPQNEPRPTVWGFS